jgi:hypothetical protein
VLRAAMPLHQGLLNFFDKSDSAFIGAYRGVHDKKEHFEIEMDYISSPSLQGKTLIICDPMLATGKSLEKAYHALLRFGIPAKTHIVSVVASDRGVRFINARMPECKLWIGDIDPELNTKSYIVPGLGDAGDLAFGVKIASNLFHQSLRHLTIAYATGNPIVHILDHSYTQQNLSLNSQRIRSRSAFSEKINLLWVFVSIP